MIGTIAASIVMRAIKNNPVKFDFFLSTLNGPRMRGPAIIIDQLQNVIRRHGDNACDARKRMMLIGNSNFAARHKFAY